jgi:hypothetical protein
MKIETLTAEQTAALATVREEWLAHGLATGPADRVEAEAGVADAYRAAGLEPPSIMIWLDSPMAGAIAAGAIAAGILSTGRTQVRDQVWNQVLGQVGNQVRDQVGNQVRDQVRDQVGNQVWNQVLGQVRDQVRDQVGNQVRTQVWAQVWDQVWDQVRDQVRTQVGAQVCDPVWAQVWAQVGAQVEDPVRIQVRTQVRDQILGQILGQVYRAAYGQHDAGWLAFYDYFRAHCTVPETERLSGLIRVARSAGWWWPFESAVILTERPTVLHRDGQARLHCPDGPAIAYPDGWSIWFWHGVRVPQDLIEKGWDTATILAERNAEVRRCAIERLGWDTFIRESGLALVASAPDPGNAPHELELYDLPEELADLYDEPARILLAVNGTAEHDGTRHRFGLPVPAHHTDPIGAAASLYGWTREQYAAMEVRR